MSVDKRWRTLTSAEILRWPQDFRRRKKAQGLFVAGFVGFSGSFAQNPTPNAQTLAQSTLATVLSALEELHPTLVVASGATDMGVPGLVYAVCVQRRIDAIGITAAAAMHHPLAPMQALIPVGRRFGDESRVFVELCDAVWILGGGPQSAREIRMAHTAGRPITVLQGLGGAADAFDEHTLPGATFIAVG